MRDLASILLTLAFVGIGGATTSNTSETSSPVNIQCNIPGYAQNKGVDPSSISDGIKHLRGLSGSATLGHHSGGGWCYRYSCSWKSGIYGCNDKDSDAEVPWSTLADYAQDIRNKCTIGMEDGKHHWKAVQGQAFDADGWNVVVGLKDGTTC